MADAWATIADVSAFTGITVTQSNIDAAQVMVELFADVVYGQTANISVKNLRMLKLAVAYQAAWMTDHPDLFTHVDLTSINQDGIFYVQGNANAMLLAPMAHRAIRRLSWKRNRNIKIRPSTRGLVNKRYQWQGGTDYEVVDSYPDNTPEQDDILPWDEM